MEDKLNFSLPEKKRESSSALTVIIVLLVVLIILSAVNIFLNRQGRSVEPQASAGLTSEQIRKLAGTLSERNLYDRAAQAWKDYLSSANITDAERAKIWFQIGTLLEKAGRYAEAIESFYRSEAAAKVEELSGQINSHIKGCFENLGKFSALRYELMGRTGIDKSKVPAGKVVAEIGPEKITEADLDAQIEQMIDNQLSAYAIFMNPEQFKEQKKRMLEQYKSPQAREEFLQNWLGQEVLYRQALDENLGQNEDVQKMLRDINRSVLAQQILNQQLADKINITDTDLQTYYAANREKYVEPESAGISHILVEDAEQASDLMKRIKGGEDFTALAKQFSKDAETGKNGGKIDMEVTRGSYVPSIGEVKELNEKIFDANAPALLDEPFKTEKGWEIVRIGSKKPERQKSFDEVREQVMSEMLSKKRQDVQQEYLKQMMTKHNVVIHTSAFAGADANKPPSKIETK